MKGLIVHDFIRFIDGGERVIFTLAQSFKFPILVGEIESNKKFLPEDIEIMELRCLKKRKFIFSKTLEYILCFKKLSLNEDLIIFSGQISPIASLNTKGRRILYCHTPPRILYDAKKELLKSLPKYQKIFFNFLLCWYKNLYEKSLKSMDIILSNSYNVKKRLLKFCNCNSIVVYPPVDIEKFKWLGEEDYFLSTARLSPLKRVDIIVKAFRKLPQFKLIVISGGEELQYIKKLAQGAKNIKIMGWVSEKDLYELIGRCLATIYIPKEEDFGISPIESMAAGKPVIGVAEGGLLETVIHGKTGFLLPPNPSEEDLISLLRKISINDLKDMRKYCEKRALLFSKERFIKKMNKILKEVNI